MNVLGWDAGECRLPLVEPSEANQARIQQRCEMQVCSDLAGIKNDG